MKRKSNPIPVRLEDWEMSALRELAEVEGLSNSEVLRILIYEGLIYFGANPQKLAGAYLRYRKVRQKALNSGSDLEAIETVFGWAAKPDVPRRKRKA